MPGRTLSTMCPAPCKTVCPGVAARYGAGLVMMHAGGGADDEGGADAAGAVRAYFLEALEAAEQAGLAGRRCAWIRASASASRGWETCSSSPVAAGAGRSAGNRCAGGCVPQKGGRHVVRQPAFEERLPGTLAIHTLAQWNGAHILRVHDVAPAVQAARVADACRRER